LSVSGNDAFLMADRGLDDQRYNTSITSITWENSTIRSWLNSYGSTANTYGTDYTGNGFIDTAFNASEKAAINLTAIGNANNTLFGTSGGNGTNDKVFFLSEAEVYSADYGFANSHDTKDRMRRIKTSAYAKAMGVYWGTSGDNAGNSHWWLRSPGHSTNDAVLAGSYGDVSCYGSGVMDGFHAVCPALHLNLSSSLWSTSADEYMAKKAYSYILHNPVRDKDDAEGVPTYSYVYFGTYPQAEVVASKSSYTAIASDYLKSEDLIEDETLYNELKNATYDSNNITTLTHNGSIYQYKKIEKDDVTYKWTDSIRYRYFRLEPIRWRVLSVNGDDAFLMADKGLEAQKYNITNKHMTWEVSTIRSWLNGYNSSINKCGVDYVGKGFIDIAFNASEKASINRTLVENINNKNGTEGGNDTEDKVFLLSEEEVGCADYGFVSNKARNLKTSTYAKVTGVSYDADSDGEVYSPWWLRSPGTLESYAVVVISGAVFNPGKMFYSEFYAVRPVDLCQYLRHKKLNIFSPYIVARRAVS